MDLESSQVAEAAGREAEPVLGKHAGLAELHRSLERKLREELGVQPLRSTQELYRSLLDNVGQ
jgi:hypothetical protein